MKSFVLIASVLLLAGAASAQTPRLVSLGEVWVADGVLAVDINIVLNNRRVSVVDFQLTDLLPGFLAFHNVYVDTLKFAAASAQAVEAGSVIFAELQLEDTGTSPDLLFSVVVINGDEVRSNTPRVGCRRPWPKKLRYRMGISSCRIIPIHSILRRRSISR